MRNTLIASAMLSSYLETEGNDYLDLITPYVLMSFPETIGEEIKTIYISSSLKDYIGIDDVPMSVIKLILNRLAKERFGAYVKKENGLYFTNRSYDRSEFEKKRTSFSINMDNFIAGFITFIATSYPDYKIDTDEATSYVNAFLYEYDYELLAEETIINRDDMSKGVYLLSQYIHSQKENSTEQYEFFQNIIKGSLVAKAIYYFFNTNKADSKIQHSKIQGEFYLDTMLLIELLGYDLEDEQKSINELVSIIIDHGGRVKTFSHYVNEAYGIIYKYAMSPETRAELDLRKFFDSGLGRDEALVYADRLIEDLKKYHVDVVDLPSYEENILRKSWHIDVSSLKQEIQANVGNNRYKASEKSWFTNDINTIEAITYLRRKHTSRTIYDTSAIFITKNKDLTKSVLRWQKKYEGSESVPFIFSDTDITALVWLGTYSKTSSLPTLKLIENTYSASQPSPKVIDKFLENIKNMVNNNELSEEIAFNLRGRAAVINELVSETKNDSRLVDEDLVKRFSKSMENSIRNEVESEIQKKYKKEWEELKELRNKMESDALTQAEKLRYNEELAFESLEKARIERENKNKKRDKIKLISYKIIDLITFILLVIALAACFMFVFFEKKPTVYDVIMVFVVEIISCLVLNYTLKRVIDFFIDL